MLSDNRNWIIFAIFLMFCDRTYSKCTQLTPCSCIFSNGQGYNLSKLADLGVLTATGSNQTFYFQPCKNVPLVQTDTTSECNKGNGSSLCTRNSTGVTFSLGTIEETTLQYETGNSKNPMLMIHHGNYTTKIYLLCYGENKTQLDFDQSPVNLEYHFRLSSPYACIVYMPHKALSTGSILVIMFLTFSGLYFIGGAVTLKLLRGAAGWEMLPNHKFWVELPSCVRDGIFFTLNCFRESPEGNYQRI